jgi:hypothetical protein
MLFAVTVPFVAVVPITTMFVPDFKSDIFDSSILVTFVSGEYMTIFEPPSLVLIVYIYSYQQ